MNLSRLSIRARITGGSLLIAILISVAAGIVIYGQVQRIVSEGQIRVLSGIEGQYVTAITTGDTDHFDPPGAGQYVAVVGPDGDVGIDTLPDGLGERVGDLAAGSPGVRIIDDGADSYVVRVTPVIDDIRTWTVIAASRRDVQTLDDVAALLIASIAGINIAFGATSWWIGSAALSPVARLRRSAADLVTAPGHDQLPVGPARDEIADLAGTLNELIAALRASADRERKIVSDASHEFRTPLAIIQTRLELAQRDVDSLDEMRVEVAAAQQTLARLSSLAASMLELSRIDAQAEPGRSTLGSLAVELADAADRGRLHVGARDIRLDYTHTVETPDVVVSVSEADFGRMCDNLVNNALAAMDAGGRIVIALTRVGDEAFLTVTDDAGGLDPDYVPHAFDRFSRQDSARTRAGAGLGLAIVAGIAELAGGSVRLDNRPGIGLSVEVRLPVSTS